MMIFFLNDESYMFVEYENPLAAQEALATFNGYKLDKAHSFKVNFVSDFDKYQEMSLNLGSEEPVPYKNPGNLFWWLTNPDAYDQFGLLHNDMFTSIYLNTRNQPTLLKSREVNRSSTKRSID
jgi:translation initiation factor 3 subunit B